MATQEPNYYGRFFWISVTSFVVPLFVAYAAFTRLAPTTKPTPMPDVSGVDHKLWDYLLRTYVENGLVDYEGISKDYLFTTYLRQIAGAQPDRLATRDEKLALHCNAYNALVIYGVINHRIHRNEKNVLNFTPRDAAARLKELNAEIEALKRSPQSDADEISRLVKQADRLRAESQFFRLKEHVFANRTISLDELEQDMIRPVFNEPRIHVALVCAARSCPAIRGEAYVGGRLEEQLQDQARLFANDSRYVSIEKNGSLGLSPILKWYAEDWDVHGGYLKWLRGLVTDDTIATKLDAAAENPAVVKFNDYDWTLNARSGSAGGTSSTGGGFGSGSVPNE